MSKPAKNISDLAALRTANTFNDLARRAATKGSEMLALIWEAGKVAKAAKNSLPHGEWMKFVEQHYEVDHRSVTRWIQFHEAVPEAKLDTVSNLTEGIKMLDPPKIKEPSSDKGKPGGEVTASLSDNPVEDAPVSSSTAADTESARDPEPETGGEDRSQTEVAHPADLKQDPEQEFRTQRSKTVKTVEALMRAFDDLNRLRKNKAHESMINDCKRQLQTAKNWQ